MLLDGSESTDSGAEAPVQQETETKEQREAKTNLYLEFVETGLLELTERKITLSEYTRFCRIAYRAIFGHYPLEHTVNLYVEGCKRRIKLS